MVAQIAVPDEAVIARPASGELCEVAPRLTCLRLGIVNVMLMGSPGAGDRKWVLVDAGVTGYRGMIEKAAAARFGDGARPAAIIMTHGHFDHVGALEELASAWDTPVYAHPAEHPFLNGSESYPPPHPLAGGGLMTLLSPLFPRRPVDVGSRLAPLPTDGSVPFLDGWAWIATPGHTRGHVSFWHEAERILIAGDACITTAQESAYEVAVQQPEIHGPPRYFTPDWAEAKRSVARIAELEVETLVTGHGPPLKGPAVAPLLRDLAARFDQIARPG